MQRELEFSLSRLIISSCWRYFWYSTAVLYYSPSNVGNKVKVSPFLRGTVKTATNWAFLSALQRDGERCVWGLKWQSIYSPGFERFFCQRTGFCTSKLRAIFTCILTKPCLLEKVKKSLYGNKLFPRFNSWLIYVHRFVIRNASFINSTGNLRRWLG